jgi:hypothetical protein
MTQPPYGGQGGTSGTTSTESPYGATAGEAWSTPSTTATNGTNDAFSSPVITEVAPNGATATPTATPGAPTPTPTRSGGRGGKTPKAAKASKADRARGPRRAHLQLRHVNPWTVLKFSCVLSIALFFVWLITIGVLYGVLQGTGVIGHINDAVTTINGSGSKNPVTPGIVFGGAAIIGVVNIVLFIALSTVGSVIYNLCADLVGGVEVTLSERES